MDSEINVKNLVKLKIVQLIKFADSFAGIEIHVPVGGKFIKLNYAQDSFIEILRRLQQKEVEEVYVHSADCSKILTHIQTAMSPKTFYDPKTLDQERVESVDASLEVVKNMIKELGVDKQTVELLKTVNMRAMSIISESPSIFSFVKKFKSSCSDEFLKTILTGYLASLVIDKFPWASIQVKEKASLAAILCDITLHKDDFASIKKFEAEGGKLTEGILRHPLTIGELLRQKKDCIPSETITIIEQHHELPNGKGFPHGITASRFNQLSSIFIVCHSFIDQLFEHEFNFEKKLDIMNNIHRTYACKNFEKSLDALVSVVSV